MLLALLALAGPVLQAGADSVPLPGAVRHPAYAPDGRLAFEMNGDLWLLGAAQATAEDTLSTRRARQLTSGPAWDREPAWTADGEELVFSSDRGGSFGLWSLKVDPDGVAGAPEPLTEAPEPDAEPAVGPDGTIVFVRGNAGRTDLWTRAADGTLKRLTSRHGDERSPSISPQGDAVAYVSAGRGGRELRVRSLIGDDDRRVVGDQPVEYPAWSPAGDAIVFATRGRRGGVWVTPTDGSYTNLVSARQAMPAWSPDGRWLALAELRLPEPGYNGDPERVGDRTAGDVGGWEGRLWIVRAPSRVDGDLSPMTVVAARDRTGHNAEAFDRVWSRLESLYSSEETRGEWRALRDKHRSRALTAPTDSALEDVVYRALRERPAARREVRGRAAVSSAHPFATAAGVEILRRGGNVIDAAVAVSFALGVVEPDASGLGGYGEMVVFLRGMASPVVIEFLTRVPESATLNNAAVLEGGRLPADGPVLANVPGTVAGMGKAWREYGSGLVEWSELLQPAIRLAEEGFVLDDAFPTTLARERDRFLQYKSSSTLFFPGGEALQPGDTLRNPDLAWTLRQIADGGADAFYRGEVARRMVTDLRGQGNAMTRADVARYFAAEREPIRGSYRGHTVYGAAPASTGGVSLVAKLNLLDNLERAGDYRDDAATAHAMIEAWKLAPSTAGRVADPSLWPVELEPFTDRGAAKTRWQRCYDPARATGPNELRREDDGLACDVDVQSSIYDEVGGCEAVVELGADSDCRATGTTAFAVADADGNAVSVTQTLGTWGGNFYVTPGLGFIYNDKLRSYRTDPDAYGARLPYARHGTSIAPTLVFTGTGAEQRPMLAVGAAGNAWITSAVYQMVAGTVDQRLGPQEALELPRFLVGVRRDGGDVRDVIVQIEDGLAPHVMRRLRGLGHQLQPISLRGELRMGYGAAVLIEDGVVRAGGDPRRSGAAGAVP